MQQGGSSCSRDATLQLLKLQSRQWLFDVGCRLNVFDTWVASNVAVAGCNVEVE
jgi:hypothetical protein